jgi:hypothetical protein
MQTCKEKKIRTKYRRRNFREVCSFFDGIYSALTFNEKQECWFQFYSLYNNFEFKYKPSDIKSISDINSIYLNKLLYSDFIMPPSNQVSDILTKIVDDKKTLLELDSLTSYQNIGIQGYTSGFAWSLLQYLQYNE